jgi:hypothetical protein
MYVINRDELESNLYRGASHGPATISIIFSDDQPGGGKAIAIPRRVAAVISLPIIAPGGPAW